MQLSSVLLYYICPKQNCSTMKSQKRMQSRIWSTNGITSSTYIDQAVWFETSHCIPPTRFNKHVIKKVLICHLEKYIKKTVFLKVLKPKVCDYY